MTPKTTVDEADREQAVDRLLQMQQATKAVQSVDGDLQDEPDQQETQKGLQRFLDFISRQQSKARKPDQKLAQAYQALDELEQSIQAKGQSLKKVA